MTDKNAMGSEVEEGFQCKPKVLDENKPVMFSALQLFICDGVRCKDTIQEDLSQKLRELIKIMGYDSGKHRVKVTRTHCNGACRFKMYAYVYRNPGCPNYSSNNSYYAWKNVHEYTDDQWKELITCLVQGKHPEKFKEYEVESQIFSENKGHCRK